MSKSLDDCIRHLNSIIEDCETYSFITRSNTLQAAACEKLSGLIDLAGRLKEQAVEQENENAANIFLGFECVGRSLYSEIAMWILLKERKPDEAWDHLVNAQDAAIGAARAHEAFAHLEKKGEKLLTIENTIFPPQVFVSSGLIVQHQECSICASEYGECNHLAGKPYMGQFCTIIVRDLKADHVAIVKTPADKSCRITSFYDDDDRERNRMTWELGPPGVSKDGFNVAQEGGDSNAKVLRATATVIRAGS